jgi:hypothetical protein
MRTPDTAALMRAGIASLLALCATVALSLAGCAGDPTPETFPAVPAPPVSGPAWGGFGRDAQHTAVGVGPAQGLDRVVWQSTLECSRFTMAHR